MFKFPSAAALLALLFALLGCANTPRRRDLNMCYQVLCGRATHKQSTLWLGRTTYENLVRTGDYWVKWSGAGVREAREVREGQSVKAAIAEMVGSSELRPSFYFLVRGIGDDESIFSGSPSDREAESLRIVPGDLLIIDPPPNHPLFREVEASPRVRTADAG